VDNLPCATKYQNVDTHEVLFEHGYRLGMYTKDSGVMFLNNHLIIKLHYHKESEYEYDFVFKNDFERRTFFFEEIYIE
jgi:transmembrane 9 superfamily protein 2/4